MIALTESTVRSSFVNVSLRERKAIVLPADLAGHDWDRLDYFGWRDPKSPLMGFIVAEIDGIVGRTGSLVIRLLQRDDFGVRILRVEFLALDLFLLLVGVVGVHLEIGTRIALAGIGGDDRIVVQIVEFAPRLRVNALCAKFGFRHGSASSSELR